MRVARDDDLLPRTNRGEHHAQVAARGAIEKKIGLLRSRQFGNETPQIRQCLHMSVTRDEGAVESVYGTAHACRLWRAAIFSLAQTIERHALGTRFEGLKQHWLKVFGLRHRPPHAAAPRKKLRCKIIFRSSTTPTCCKDWSLLVNTVASRAPSEMM